MLAVVYAAEHFHLYLYGEKFTITTDHRPFLGIGKSLKPAAASIERWRLCLLPYRYSLIYQPGKKGSKPRGLSHTINRKKTTLPKSITPEEVKEATEEDSLLQKVKAAVANGRWNDPQLSNFSPFKEELSVINGFILR